MRVPGGLSSLGSRSHSVRESQTSENIDLDIMHRAFTITLEPMSKVPEVVFPEALMLCDGVSVCEVSSFFSDFLH